MSAGAALAAVDSLLGGGLDQEAAALATRAVAEHGDDPLFGWQLEARLGLALLRVGRAADALPHLEQASQREPLVAAHHLNLGSALLALGRRGRALTEFSLAVEADPSDAAARLAYGQLLVLYRDYEAARSQLAVARRLCGGCEEAVRALAMVHIAAGDWAAALEPLERLYAARPDSTLRRNLLAACDATGNDARLAELLAARATSAWTADEWRYAARSESRTAPPAPWSAAAVEAAAGPQPPPADPAFWGQVSLNLLAADAPAAGLAAVDRALSLAPEDPVLHNNRAVLLLRLGREEEARAAVERARTLAAEGR